MHGARAAVLASSQYSSLQEQEGQQTTEAGWGGRRSVRAERSGVLGVVARWLARV